MTDRAALLRTARPDREMPDGVPGQLDILRTLLSLSRSRPRTWSARVTGVLLAAVVVKALLLAIALAAGAPVASIPAALPPLMHGCLFFGFGIAGLWLIAGAGHDRRAAYLGGVLIVVGNAFAREAGREAALHVHAFFGAIVVRAALRQNVDSLLPIFAWLFVQHFPQRPLVYPSQQIARAGVIASSTIAAILMAVDALRWDPRIRIPVAFQIVNRSNAFWLLTFGLTIAALAFMLIRSPPANPSERRRIRWFTVSLVIGMTPVLAEVIGEALFPGFARWAQNPQVRSVLGTVLFSFLLTIPATTTYAVLATRVLDVRIVLRRALRCALAKYLCMTLSLVPMGVVIWTFYVHRYSAVRDLARLPAIQTTAALALVGLVLLACTDRVLRQLDRLFFGPAYDSGAINARARDRCSRAAGAGSIAAVLREELQAALDPFTVAVLVVDPNGQAYRDPEESDTIRRGLDAESTVIETIARERGHAIAVTDHLLRAVREDDAVWLAQTGVQLAAGMRASDGRIIGVLGVSERRNDRPYQSEDASLLTDLAANGALALEHHFLRCARSATTENPWRETAAECPACGLITAVAEGSVCDLCRVPLERCALPRIVSQKFLLRRRIGRGGMGVVYLAEDLILRRNVALKTLPYLSRAAEERCRSEAWAMASLSHPNVATVHGWEFCDSRPVLVMEYLAGGTLATLGGRRRSVREVVDCGLALCDGLGTLHRKNLMHGDIKPSNIAFDAEGIPKLLDFGLATVIAHTGFGETATGQPVARWATPRYRCPDSFRGRDAADPQADLWSLAAVLYEELVGPEALDILASQRVPRRRSLLTNLRPDVPEELSVVLERALDPRPETRPGSAEELGLWLRRARPVA